MQSARSTAAAAIAARISGSFSASSGKLRWQCESTYMAGRGNRRAPRERKPRCSDRLRGLGRRQRRAERLLDPAAQGAALLVGREAHADALRATTGGISRRDPADLARDRIALRIVGQREQEVDVLAELVVAGGGNE